MHACDVAVRMRRNGLIHYNRGGADRVSVSRARERNYRRSSKSEFHDKRIINHRRDVVNELPGRESRRVGRGSRRLARCLSKRYLNVPQQTSLRRSLPRVLPRS